MILVLKKVSRLYTKGFRENGYRIELHIRAVLAFELLDVANSDAKFLRKLFLG